MSNVQERGHLGLDKYCLYEYNKATLKKERPVPFRLKGVFTNENLKGRNAQSY